MLAPERKKQEKPNPDVLLLKFWEDSKTRKYLIIRDWKLRYVLTPIVLTVKGYFL